MKRFLSLTLAAFAFAACTRNKGSDITVSLPGGKQEKLAIADTLRINVVSEPPTLDWHKASDTTSTMLISNIMDGLVQYDMHQMQAKLEPALATSWEALAGGVQWRFKIRGGVQWTDGVKFEAQQVLDGWQRLLAKETAGGKANYLFPIKNARAFSTGEKPWSAVGAKLTAPDEITVELERPMSFFPYLLRSPWTNPIRLDIVKKYGDHWTDPDKIVTLGAYRVKSWEHDKLIVLERNEAYWGAKAEIKYVAGLMVQEQATALNLFDSGRLDSVHNLPSIELKKMRARPEYQETPLYRINYYGFNVTKVPTDNVLVRRAIAHAIDREQIVQLIAGGEKPLSGWIPPGLLGYDDSVGLKFDVAKAKDLLRQAGYGENKKLPKIILGFNTNEDHARVAENIQAQLKKNLGVDIELKNEEWKVYLSTLKSDPPNMYRLSWQAGYPDPDDFMSMMLSYSENNWTRWKNPKYDDLVLKAAAAMNEAERAKIYREAQKVMTEEDVAVVPLHNMVAHVLVAKRIEDYPANATEVLVYKNARMKKP